MNRFRIGKRTSVLITVLTISLLVAACSTVDKDPARKILTDAMKAMGGKSKLTGWTTRVEKGTLISIWPGWGRLTAECAHYTNKPDKLLLDQDYSANDHPFYFVYTLNGDQTWSEVNMGIRQNQRATDMLEKRMREVDGISYFLTSCDSFYIIPGVPDDSLYAGTDITRIACIAGEDTTLLDFLNTSHLPARRIESGQGGETQMLMDDYREVSGRKIPFRIRHFNNGALTDEYKWDEISFDIEIDPAIFEKNKPSE